jgi:hypothetical protein
MSPAQLLPESQLRDLQVVPRHAPWLVLCAQLQIWQQQRGAGERRDSALRSASLLSQRPAHSAHRPSRACPRGPSGRLPAVIRVRNGCPDLPAGCLQALCRRSAALRAAGALSRWSTRADMAGRWPCLLCRGGCNSRSDQSMVYVWCSVMLGGAGAAVCGVGLVQKRVEWSDLNGRRVLSF